MMAGKKEDMFLKVSTAKHNHGTNWSEGVRRRILIVCVEQSYRFSERLVCPPHSWCCLLPKFGICFSDNLTNIDVFFPA